MKFLTLPVFALLFLSQEVYGKTSSKNDIPVEKTEGVYLALNRGQKIFKQALVDFQKDLSEEQRTLLEERKEYYAVSYIDPWGGARLVMDAENVTAIARPLNPRIQNYISDKREFGRQAKKAGIENTVVPRNFETVEEALKVLSADENASDLIFIKGRRGTKGRAVNCKKVSDLKTMEALSQEEILQEGVTDLRLYEGRKFTIRAYLIAHHGNLYFSRHSTAIVHGVKYDPNSADFRVQVDHIGASEGASEGLVDGKPFMTPLENLGDDGRDILAGLVQAVRQIGPMYEQILQATAKDPNRFGLYGVDAIPREDGTVRLIESNHWPNLVNTKQVNAGVEVPMVTSFLRKLFGIIGDEGDSELMRVYEYETKLSEFEVPADGKIN